MADDLPADVLAALQGDPGDQSYLPAGLNSQGLTYQPTGGLQIPPNRGSPGILAAIAGAVISAVGIDALPAVAVALGYNAADLLRAWVNKKGGGMRRRRRGVTARQLAITRRTIRVVEGMHRNLQKAFGRASHHSFARSGGHSRKGK